MTTSRHLHITSGSVASPMERVGRSMWQEALANAIRDPRELFEVLGIDLNYLPNAMLAAARFPLVVPRRFAGLMQHGDVNDPLLRQVLPLGEELAETDGFVADPVGDRAAEVEPGVIHKYPGRILLVATGVCAVHCRYCFRREFPYGEASASADEWHLALEYLRGNPSVHEVVLSGGDPLSLSDRRLAALFSGLRTIPSVRRLRIHSRYPIVLPERIDDAFMRTLDNVERPIALVVHTNHARELDQNVGRALLRLHRAGITLLNQAVLLRRVNDDVETLVALSEALFDVHVVPYYLNLLDRVRGGAHFEVEEEKGRRLIKALRERLPGYLVPRLVADRPGQPAKTILGPERDPDD